MTHIFAWPQPVEFYPTGGTGARTNFQALLVSVWATAAQVSSKDRMDAMNVGATN
jgi:hypothetical protein